MRLAPLKFHYFAFYFLVQVHASINTTTTLTSKTSFSKPKFSSICVGHTCTSRKESLKLPPWAKRLVHLPTSIHVKRSYFLHGHELQFLYLLHTCSKRPQFPCERPFLCLGTRHVVVNGGFFLVSLDTY